MPVVRRVAAYFTLASVANNLSSRRFSPCPNTRESLSPIMRTGYDARAGRLRKILINSQDLFELLKKHLAGKWFVTDAEVK
jgi:hypothetical protein